ncbi:MAG: RES domain-containing protein [Tepidisphaeraceae bacterium]|jgi:RES domain-containing protein
MHAHPAHTNIHAALQHLSPAAAFHGILYRACDPLYANSRDLLRGEGSRKLGGRWNAPGGAATVYLAQSIEGAIAESLGLSSHYGFDPAKRLPLTLVAVDVALEIVIDFTDAGLRKSLGVTLAAMTGCDWRNENAAGREALTQVLGRAAFELGAHGVIVPSAVKRTFKNLNVFPANLSGASHLKIRGSEKLPPPAAPGII